MIKSFVLSTNKFGCLYRYLCSDQPSTVNRQPSTVNRQLSTVNRQLSTVNRQPSTVNRQPSTVNYQQIIQDREFFRRPTYL